MAFNLRKFSADAEKTQEQRLQEQREHYGVETENPINVTNGQLDGLRKNDQKDPKVYNGLLDEARTKKEYDKTIEGQMDDHIPPEQLPKRTGEDDHDALPINLLAETRDKERAKAYEKATVKDEDTEKWDKLLGVDMLEASDTIKPGPSQLHNHEDRFKRLTEKGVLKNDGVKDMVMASLKDADAMLYFIFHKAATEGRDLTKKEKTLVDGITSDKMKLTEMLLNQ